MNRRGFIGALAGAFALDPERLLWVPGAKTISIAAPRVVAFNDLLPIQPGAVVFGVGDIVTFDGLKDRLVVTAGDSVNTVRFRMHPEDAARYAREHVARWPLGLLDQ